jgi:enoyl-CoA hydratase
MTTVLVETPQPHVRVLTLNRPEVLNALSVDLCVDLTIALDSIAEDNDAWVVVLTGAGRGFCSGLDLDDHGIIPNIDGLPVARIGPKAMRLYSQLTLAVDGLPQPVIAAINGPAYGGGMCLSLAADLRIASESAEFNATGIVNGLTSAELGASWLLPRLIGVAHANDLLLTGRRLGLVSRVVPDAEVVDVAIDMAASMCEFSPFGLQMTKAILHSNLEVTSLRAGVEFEDRNQLMLGMTDNLPEAIRARNAGRKPVYTDGPRDLGRVDGTTNSV